MVRDGEPPRRRLLRGARVCYGAGTTVPTPETMMNATADPRFDAANLYREEVYTDRRVGTVRTLVPVKSDGATDPARATLYVGQISVMTPMGTLPVSFEIAATTLAESLDKFAAAARTAMDETMHELQQMRREAASSIVIPEPGAVPPSGGSGRIRMP
jgi:hypothetical protein